MSYGDYDPKSGEFVRICTECLMHMPGAEDHPTNQCGMCLKGRRFERRALHNN